MNITHMHGQLVVRRVQFPNGVQDSTSATFAQEASTIDKLLGRLDISAAFDTIDHDVLVTVRCCRRCLQLATVVSPRPSAVRAFWFY